MTKSHLRKNNLISCIFFQKKQKIYPNESADDMKDIKLLNGNGQLDVSNTNENIEPDNDVILNNDCNATDCNENNSQTDIKSDVKDIEMNCNINCAKENSTEVNGDDKVKGDFDNHTNDEKITSVNDSNVSNNKTISVEANMERCDTCRQFINNSDIIYYQGHPQDAVEEFIALTNEKLVLASGTVFLFDKFR